MKHSTIFLALVLSLLTLSVNAQYYSNTFNNAGTNPGGLHTDPEQPFGAPGVTVGDGYSSILANGLTTLQWSSNQTIPFTFSFNGNPVTSYKVSNSGVLTFTTSATTVPSFTNATIPNNTIPDNSVMVWGLQQSGGNDGVIKKTHGTAPNRQHWITFASFSAPGATGSQWTYWSIVLEETSNKIYLVDQRTYQTPLSLTLGIQLNSTTAYQVSGSPTISSNTTNGGAQSDPLDNSYWEFIPGSRPTNDAGISSVNLNSIESNQNPITISGDVINNGSAALTSVVVGWSDDGGTTVNLDTISNLNIPTSGTATFSHSVNWTPAAGIFYDVEVWTLSPNGMMDGYNLNDTVASTVFVNSGITVAKTTLFEQFTTAGCQFCPDGAYIAAQMESNYANVTTVSVHSCFGTDNMTNADATTLCSTLGVNAAPTGMVDRKLFDTETDVAFGRGAGALAWQQSLWATRSLTQANAGSPVDVSLSGGYNPTSRNINVNLDASFVDFVSPGTNLSVSLMVVEDSVIGSGPGWDQVNFYNGQAGHPFAGRGNPITNYPHRRVLRDILPRTFGDTTVVPSSYALNTTYTRNFNFTLNNAWDPNQVSLIAIVSSDGGADISKYEILNVDRIDLGLITSIKEEKAGIENSLKVYPNPSDLPFTYMEFKMDQGANVQATISDITGKVVSIEDFGTLSQGNQRIELNTQDLENGFYFVNLRVGDQQVSRKISILK